MSGPVNLPAWKRREHYELFRDAVQPFFALTVELDVTALRARCAAPQGPSFFLSALYACLRAANDTEAFRLRLRPEGVWLHDSLAITSTILREDETFAFGRFELRGSRNEFFREGAAELERVRRPAPLQLPQEQDDALIYHSTIPWLRFTSFTNAIGNPRDSVPRVVFGRCTTVGDSVVMPVSVEVHHALVDGLDVAWFVERLERELSSKQ